VTDQKIILIVSKIEDLLADVCLCLKRNSTLEEFTIVPRKNFFPISQFLNGDARLNYFLVVLPDTLENTDDGTQLVRLLTKHGRMAISYSAQKAMVLYRGQNGQGCGNAVKYITDIIRGAL
jgi:hypothetical protein